MVGKWSKCAIERLIDRKIDCVGDGMCEGFVGLLVDRVGEWLGERLSYGGDERMGERMIGLRG